MTETIKTLIEPIRERLDAATPGPWFQGRASDRYENTREVYSEREVSATSEDVATFIHHPEDAALIANSPTDLARLLAAVQAVEEWCLNLDAVEKVNPSSSDNLNASAGAIANVLRKSVAAALTEAR